MENILLNIQNGQWEEALKEYLDYTETHKLDPQLCILGATILEQFGEWDSMYDLICSGLKLDPENYELYILLGNYFGLDNADKAYIAYSNALFWALKSGNDADVDVIRGMMSDFRDNNDISVRDVSVIILADDDLKYLNECRESVYRYCDVDRKEVKVAYKKDSTLPAAMNRTLGEVNDSNDVLFVSSDVIMMPNALFYLRIGMYDDKQNGSCGSVSNYAFYKQVPLDHEVKTPSEAHSFALKNNVPERHAYETKAAVDMNFMLLSRKVIDKITPLDERFVLTHFLSNDIGISILDAGFLNKVCWNSYVFRYVRETLEDIDPNRYYDMFLEEREQIKEKWDFTPDYYMNSRMDLIELIKDPRDKELSVLEIGAGLGSTLSRIKYMYPNAKVQGIEIVERVAKFSTALAEVTCADVEKYEFKPEDKFDYIICGDVLEHLVDPYSLISRFKEHLNENGCIIASIPNIMNAYTVYELLHGYFTYKDSGVLDRTHLRFFTINEIQRMFEERGYELISVEGTYSPELSTQYHKEFWDKLLSIEGIAQRRFFDIVQYVVVARKK